jgi:biopolymer transport protein ExbD
VKIPLPGARRRARIEIIPLIDIVFFLLATFVMVSLSMVKNQGIPVSLPVSSTSGPQSRDNFNVVTVTETGEIYFDKEKISMEALVARLKKLKYANRDPRIFLNGDTRTELGSVVKVLDEIRKQGITKVAIQTTPSKPAGKE